MKRLISIRAGLLRDLAILVLLLGVGIFAATFVGARQAVRGLSESLMGQTLTTVEARLDAFFAEGRQQLEVARGQAAAGAFELDALEETPGFDDAGFAALRDRRNRLLAPIIEGSTQISSLMLADDHGREHLLLRTEDGWRNRCVSADDGRTAHWLEWKDDASPVERREELGYDPRSRPWYGGAVETGAGAVHWTEPYTFFTTKQPGITCSTTYDLPDGRERVIAFDLLLSDISEFTRKLRVSDRGIAAVLTADRRLLGLPGLASFDDPVVRAEAHLRRPSKLGLTLLDDAHAALPATESEAFRFVSEGEAWWGRTQPYALSPDRGLGVAILVPEADLVGNRRRLRVTIAVLVGIVLAAGVLRAAAVARLFSRPIEALVAQSERMTQGDLAPGAPIASSINEIQRLADAQEHMRQGFLARLRLEKVERDLNIAREIQHGLLPQAPPEIAGFEIAGWNQAADETGGDFYDWIILPDGRVVITLADVVGHGIGPALIVAVYRAYLRAATFGTRQLSEAISHINDLLCADIPENRFITAVVGVIDPDAGRMLMVSAGHAPLLYCEGATGVVHSWDADDLPLGIMGGRDYGKPREITFQYGDTLVLLTDGFFEWANAASEQFGIPRLESFVRENRHRPPAELIDMLYRTVLEHAGGTEQDDDLTAVVIRRTAGR